MSIKTTLSLVLHNLAKDILQLKTVGKTLGVCALGGASTSAMQLLNNIGQEDIFFTPAGLLKLKHAFLSGMAIAVIGYFLPSPLRQTLHQPDPPAKPKPSA
jgi:hypothetical protein